MFQLAHFWEDGLDVDDIKNNEGFTVNNDFFVMSDEVTSENHCRIASQVTTNRY